MIRVVVATLVCSLAGTAPAFAGETLWQSATRAAQALARMQALPPPNAAAANRVPTVPAVDTHVESMTPAGKLAQGGLQAAQEQQPGLESSGLRKRTKILIGIGAALGFAAIAYSIDRGVVNNTPSTLGTRKD